MLAPPRRSLGRNWNAVFLGLVLLALAAYLPAGWFGMPEWRKTLLAIGNEQLHLPAARTPQPWMTFEAFSLFALALAWAYYLLAHIWVRRDRTVALRIYLTGILVLGLMTIITFAVGWKFPIWHQEENRGWFPNRNQTANVLALAGIMIYALGFSEIRSRSKTSLLWFLSLPVICGALIVSFSRAGILIFFVGALLWHLRALFFSKSSKNAYVGVAAVLLLLSIFFLMGGETFERFHLDPTNEKYPLRDFRVLIQRDAIPFASTAPGLGIGLGNFGDLFTRVRQRSINQALAIHPESDWLWAATELGWLAPVLLLAGIVMWVRTCFPFEPGTDRYVRSAAAACGLLFAGHALIDVPGHRIGSVLPALFVASIAVSPRVSFRMRSWVAPVFRIAGLFFCAVGIAWLLSCMGKATLPTSCEFARLEQAIEEARDAQQYERVIELANRAQRIAPLAWNIYFERASAEAVTQPLLENAFKDFQVARFLQPNLADLYFKEGAVWMTADQPRLALEAWDRALRSSPQKAHDYFYRMTELVKHRPALQSALREISRVNMDCLLLSLGLASKSEVDIEVSRLLASDPDLKSLSKKQLEGLFASWFQRGDRKRLLEGLHANPAWLQVGWRWLAENYASEGDYKLAYETVRQFETAPTLPTIESKLSLPQLEKDFLNSQYDTAKGIALYMAQVKNGNIDAALTTVRKLNALKESPKYLSHVEADLWAKKENWQKAWQAWVQYSQR
jgi:tetratricopeptide (TPR) repeat protein